MCCWLQHHHRHLHCFDSDSRIDQIEAVYQEEVDVDRYLQHRLDVCLDMLFNTSCSFTNNFSSTITVSIIRLWALAQYGHSTNPLYDNVLSGIFSPLELNVGIVAMCMPAFRRFMARFAPSWGSSNGSKQYRGYENGTPNGRVSVGRRSKKTDTFGGSLFQTNILKVSFSILVLARSRNILCEHFTNSAPQTVDTRIEEKTSQDDEVQLVELRKQAKADASSSTDNVSQAPPSERL